MIWLKGIFLGYSFFTPRRPKLQCKKSPTKLVSVGTRRKEGNVLFNDALNTFLFTVIWHLAYGKGPLR